MDPTTPVLPTVIVTHPTPLPPVPRRTASYSDSSPSMASTYISSFFPSDSSASCSTTRRSSPSPSPMGSPEKIDHTLLSPYSYSPTRRRKTRRHQTAVQLGLLLIATLLLWTSTRWTDEWAGKGVMGLLVPSASLPGVLGGGILEAWRSDADGAPVVLALDDDLEIAAQGSVIEESNVVEAAAVQSGKLGAMKVDEWNAYVANQQSMTGYAGPAATMEAWDFH